MEYIATQKQIDNIVKEYSELFDVKLDEKVKLVLSNSRKEFDKHYECETEDWIVGFAKPPNIYYLHPEIWEKESCHKKPVMKSWNGNIRHEIIHVFEAKIYGRHFPIYPSWLAEGISVYFSGEFINEPKRLPKPKNFKTVIDFFSNQGGDYAEAGYLVKTLVEKYGIDKILKLLKVSPKRNSPKVFNGRFKEIYGFELTYDNINKLI